jgi:dihydrofolate reductase
MPRVVYFTATTFNGFIATADNSLEWLFAVDADEALEVAGTFLDGVGAVVCGSTTYEWIFEHEGLADSPDKWQESYGDRPTFVFTSRDLARPEGADIRFVEGGVGQHLAAIRGAAGARDIWIIGGGDLAGQFFDAGALDEIQVTLTPVALANGAPLFPREVHSDRLRLSSVEQFGQCAHLTYEVTG